MANKLSPAYIMRKKKKNGAPAFSRAKIKEAASQLGRRGGLIGGPARVGAIGKRTKAIAIHAACARWSVDCYCDDCQSGGEGVYA